MLKLSNFLLKLSRGAVEKPANEFKDWALSETKGLIPFDSCMWGKGSWINGIPVSHNFHFHNIVGNYIESWSRFQHEDKLVRDVTLHNNRSFNVDVAREYANTNIYNLHCKNFGIEHIIAIGETNPDTQLINSICFYRSDINNPFTEQERSLQEILFPHLIEARRTNWLTNLPHMFSANQRSSFNAIAASDNAGLLQVAMPSFVEICRAEWPEWKGPFLPQEVIEIPPNRNYLGKSIVISRLSVNELILLRARTKVSADKLSSRELEIARHISEGSDYKSIAINLNISPATVKTHTNNIYSKLEINDKANLAVALAKLAA